MNETKEVGGWYSEGENTYSMIDPVSGGVWMIHSKREETEESLNSLVDFHLTSGGLTRPAKGTVSGLKRII